MIDWDLINAGCPNCGAQEGGPRGLQYHGLSAWCLRCGWAKNWEPEPKPSPLATELVRGFLQAGAELATLLFPARQHGGTDER